MEVKEALQKIATKCFTEKVYCSFSGTTFSSFKQFSNAQDYEQYQREYGYKADTVMGGIYDGVVVLMVFQNKKRWVYHFDGVDFKLRNFFDVSSFDAQKSQARIADFSKSIATKISS